MKKYMKIVNTLIESFPYIKEFYGKTIVIKYGGHAMSDETLKTSFAVDMVLLKHVGINPVVVHGGGPQIGDLLTRLGKESTFIEGLRITDSETMDIAEMVLVGKVNKEIVNNINAAGGKAVGLSGKDGKLFIAEKVYHTSQGKEIDLGQVGRIKAMNTGIINLLEKDMFIPVIAPIGCDEQGITYNINADVAAGKVAEEINAEKLILLTDIEGVVVDGDLASSLTISQVEELIEKKIITGGMIPKVKCCTSALNGNVTKTHIIDGRVEHAVLLEIFTDAGIGTEIVD